MAKVKHGLINTPPYRTWRSMKMRCLVPKATSYAAYGGLGIKIYEPWLDFASFLADMGLRPEGKTLDRKDSYGDYTPENCRWATPVEQQHNRRIIKKTASGYRGVYLDRTSKINKWRAQLYYDGKQQTLGKFSNKVDAAMIILSAEAQLI